MAKESAVWRKKAILPIPADAKTDPRYLNGLSNDEFVKNFGKLQKIVIAAYEDIEKTPFSWGYPQYLTTEGYYSRVADFLFSFVNAGSAGNGTITVDTKKFFALQNVKRHRKPEQMISGFEKLGFSFENFSKKSESFTCSYPANPGIITVLNAYIHAQNTQLSPPYWSYGKAADSLSYRYLEDPSRQKYECVFHALMDYASANTFEIQCRLHAEAAKSGFKIDPKEPTEKSCMLYKKGSKRLLLVGEREENGKAVTFSKAILRDVHITEKDKMQKLYNQFPETFTSNCHMCNKGDCTMRIPYEVNGEPRINCAYGSFMFNDITLENAMDILEVYKIENKIK
jgi:hypothetical protein